jgi:hypothetical protein
MVSAQLRWYSVSGAYAGALVAAENAEDAMRLAREQASGISDWYDAAPIEDSGARLRREPPGPPTAAGVYYAWAE